MIETILSGLFGGVLRLAPEMFKIFDRASERKHEIAMLDREMELQKLNASSRAHEIGAAVSVKEMESITAAFEEQAATATKAGQFVSALSALVRPVVTYAFVSAYFVVKAASYLLAIDQGGEWKEVLTALWGQDDISIMFMIIQFWFVGRVIDKHNGK